jgi:hypothetical protein
LEGPQYPATARFLSPEERDFAVNRLMHDSTDLATHYEHKFVIQALTDWKCWMQACIYIGSVCLSPLPSHPLTNLSPYSVLIPLYAFSLFLPTIINDFGYKATEAQLLSTPPYVAGCICTIIVGIISDKYKSRGPFACLSMTVAIIGYAILYGTNLKNPHGARVYLFFFTLLRMSSPRP